MRIAFVRVAQETNAFSPIETELADFAHDHEGAELLAMATRGPEVPGMFRRAELAGFVREVRRAGLPVELVPLFSLWAPPGGPLSAACFGAIEARLDRALRAAGPIDGLLFVLHGAMGARGTADPEARLLSVARGVLGEVPIVVTHDLHANLTRERVELATAIVAYTTNPHRDLAATGARAARILLGAVTGALEPVTAWRSLPLLVGGGTTVDVLAPMRAVFRRARRAERERTVLAVSIFMVHPWIAHPHVGWSIAVVTDRDAPAAEALAEELAELCWAQRTVPPPPFATAQAAIARARGAWLRRRVGCVLVSDASDVVAAGAPGDSTHLVRALLHEARGLRCYAAMRDPAAVARLWSVAPGQRASLDIGGRLDPQRSRPIAVTGVVAGQHERPGFLRSVVLVVDHVHIVLTEGPALALRPSFFAEVGLSIWRADIVVVKSLFLARLFFLPYARMALLVRTHGATDLDAAYALPFDGPMYPRDDVADWRERDRARRAVPSGARPMVPMPQDGDEAVAASSMMK